MEAVGELIVVVAGLTGQKIGDSVVYVRNSMGSYAEEQILPADEVVPVPPVNPIIAASIMLKDMITRYLVYSCFRVKNIHTACSLTINILTLALLFTILSEIKTNPYSLMFSECIMSFCLTQVERGLTILVHAATGGVGSLLW
ncbi:hypothetical protein SLA2020_140090 [Shorea laevis]